MYYNFRDDTLDKVSALARLQAGMSWQEFLSYCGIAPPHAILSAKKGVAYLDFVPSGTYDASKAIILHAPMANPLDPQNAYQAATVFAANPGSRLLAFANPGGPGHSAGRLAASDLLRTARGDLTPAVKSCLSTIAGLGISSVAHIGCSYGAERSMVAAANAGIYGHTVTSATVIDPPSVVARSMLELALSFGRSGRRLQHYVRMSQSPALLAARKRSIGGSSFRLGLLRPSNLAIAKAIAAGTFEDRAAAALLAQPAMRVSIAWGSESELAVDHHLSAIAGRLQLRFGEDRVRSMRVAGAHHAMANDLYLLAALSIEGLA